jgi:hypothetical protein
MRGMIEPSAIRRFSTAWRRANSSGADDADGDGLQSLR